MVVKCMNVFVKPQTTNMLMVFMSNLHSDTWKRHLRDLLTTQNSRLNAKWSISYCYSSGFKRGVKMLLPRNHRPDYPWPVWQTVYMCKLIVIPINPSLAIPHLMAWADSSIWQPIVMPCHILMYCHSMVWCAALISILRK